MSYEKIGEGNKNTQPLLVASMLFTPSSTWPGAVDQASIVAL
jgi:hypothetical protein